MITHQEKDIIASLKANPTGACRLFTKFTIIGELFCITSRWILGVDLVHPLVLLTAAFLAISFWCMTKCRTTPIN